MIIKQKSPNICYIFKGFNDIKYDALECHFCMMIIQHANILGLVHIVICTFSHGPFRMHDIPGSSSYSYT